MTIALRQRPLARVVAGIVRANDGAWFDPSDMSTLYQDAAGTIPVTAVEQPVGLVLDKSQGLMLGPELVVNGDFSNGSTGWSLGTGWSVPALSAVFTGVTAGGLWQNILTVGRMYKIEFDVTVNAQYIGLLSESLTPPTLINKSGHKTLYLTATSSVFSVYAGKNANIVLDNISVRELYGYHATQSITASRPTLSARKNILLATEALAMQSVTTLAATYTLSFTGTGSVTLSGTATGTLTGTGADRVSLTFTPTAGTLTLTVSGSVTKAQLEFGASAGPYQRVNTSTDYDTDERYFPKYLRFDGVDDYLNLPYMGLYANGSASVVAGVYGHQFGKTYHGRVFCESLVSSNSPTYALCIDKSDIKTINSYMRNDTGTAFVNIDMSLPQNSTNIISIVDGGNSIKSFQNAVQKVSATYTRSGSVTLGSTTIGKGLNNGSTEIWMGDLYSLIITKSALSDAQRIKCERYTASKAGVQL